MGFHKDGKGMIILGITDIGQPICHNNMCPIYHSTYTHDITLRLDWCATRLSRSKQKLSHIASGTMTGDRLISSLQRPQR